MVVGAAVVAGFVVDVDCAALVAVVDGADLVVSLEDGEADTEVEVVNVDDLTELGETNGEVQVADVTDDSDEADEWWTRCLR